MIDIGKVMRRGARVVPITRFHKHPAPLESELTWLRPYPPYSEALLALLYGLRQK